MGLGDRKYRRGVPLGRANAGRGEGDGVGMCMGVYHAHSLGRPGRKLLTFERPRRRNLDLENTSRRRPAGRARTRVRTSSQPVSFQLGLELGQSLLGGLLLSDGLPTFLQGIRERLVLVAELFVGCGEKTCALRVMRQAQLRPPFCLAPHDPEGFEHIAVREIGIGRVSLDEVLFDTVPDAKRSRAMVPIEADELRNAQALVSPNLRLPRLVGTVAPAQDFDGEVRRAANPGLPAVILIAGPEADEDVGSTTLPRIGRVPIDELVGADVSAVAKPPPEGLVERHALVEVAW
jgi:hypothetical protein